MRRQFIHGMSIAVILGTAGDAAAAEGPVWVYPATAYVNLATLDDGLEDIRDQLEIFDEVGAPVELRFHRGEYQAKWIHQQAFDVVIAVRERYAIGYVPEPMRPFSDAERRLIELPWDEAVAAATQLHTCAVTFGTAEVDCSRTGGIAALREVFGKSPSSVAEDGPHAVSTMVYRSLGIPVLVDEGDHQGLFGSDAAMYWYMGQLVLTPSPSDRWSPVDGSASTAWVADAGPLVFPGVTDTLHQPAVIEFVRATYSGDVPGFEALRPPADERVAPGKRRGWLKKLEGQLSSLDELAVSSGGAVLGAADLLQRVVPPDEVITADELDRAAGTFLAMTTEQPPLSVPLGDHSLSLADLYEGLSDALLAYRASGSFPDEVRTTGILGPIGYPSAADVEGGRGGITPATLLAALPAVDDRVHFGITVAEGTAPIHSTELMMLMAELYRALRRGPPPVSIERPDVPPSLRPEGVPLPRHRRRITRWDYYTHLQYWTAKEARFGPTPLAASAESG